MLFLEQPRALWVLGGVDGLVGVEGANVDAADLLVNLFKSLRFLVSVLAVC